MFANAHNHTCILINVTHIPILQRGCTLLITLLRVIKSIWIRGAWNTQEVFTNFGCKSSKEETFGRLNKQEDNIKMYLREFTCEDVNHIKVLQDNVKL
jgi:hypothetical protein